MSTGNIKKETFSYVQQESHHPSPTSFNLQQYKTMYINTTEYLRLYNKQVMRKYNTYVGNNKLCTYTSIPRANPCFYNINIVSIKHVKRGNKYKYLR